MGGVALSSRYPWRSLSSVSVALALVALLFVSPSVRGTSPAPTVAVHMDLGVGLATAKTYDLETIAVHDYTVVTQQRNGTGNKTTNVTTLIPSPGPVQIQLFSANGARLASVGGVFNLSEGIYNLAFAVTPDFGFDTITVKVFDFSLNRTATAVFGVILSETYKYILLQNWFANLSAWVVGFTQGKEAGRDGVALIENVGFAFVWIFLILLTLHRIARKRGTLSPFDRLKLMAKATIHVDPMVQAMDPDGYNADGVSELRVQELRANKKDLEKLMMEDLRDAIAIAHILDLDDAEKAFLDDQIKTLRAHRGLDPKPKERKVVRWLDEKRPTPPVDVPPAVIVEPEEKPPTGSVFDDPKKTKGAKKGESA